MSTANDLFLAIEANNHASIWRMLNEMDVPQIVAAGTSLGPKRLRELLLQFVGRSEAPMTARSIQRFLAPPPTGFTPIRPAGQLAKQAIPEILMIAFKDPAFRLPAQTRDAALSAEIKRALDRIHTARKEKPLITLYRDVTGTIPNPTTCPAPLGEQDFKAVAGRNKIEIAAIKAVAKVESGGRNGFDESYRPKILFEAHHFSRHTQKLFNLSHPHLSTPTRAEAKKFYGWDQYSRLFEALVLDPVAACKSASWGKFQVLGSNHNGWPDPVSFARAMFVSEANHLKSFEDYCIKNNLMKHLKSKNWAGFAYGYNGENYAEFDYDTKMANAYKSFGGK